MAYFKQFRRATVIYQRPDGSTYLSVTAPLEAPSAGAFFGLPSDYFTVDYWKSRIGEALAFKVDEINNSPVSSVLFHFCDSNADKQIKATVFKENKYRLDNLIALLQKAQADQGSPEFALQKVAASPNYINFVGYGGHVESLDVSKSLTAALVRFYNANGKRLPDRVFNEYNGDPRLPAPEFELDEFGRIKCPTWAAVSFFSHPNTASVFFTDDGPRFLNEYEYRRFQAAFWQSVTGLMPELKRTASNYGGNYVNFERPSNLNPFFNDGAGFINPEYVPPIPLELAKKIADFYSKSLIEANEQAHLAAVRGQLMDFVGKVFLMFGVANLIGSVGSLFAGEITYSNVFNTIKLADKIGIVEADKIVAIGNFGDALYGMSQSAIDSIAPAEFTESSTLDDAITIDYTAPEYGDMTMDEFDWDAWLADQDQLLLEAGWELPAWEDIAAFDWSSVDWGSVTEYEYQPIDLGDFGLDTEQTAVDLAANVPGMSAEQLAAINQLDEASQADALKILEETKQLADSGGFDFLAVLQSVVKNVTGATGAFLTLYTTYKKAEQSIQVANGKAPTAPRVTTRPTVPGQTVRQPDGSVSTMLPDGSIRTVRPNGSIVITAPNQTMPTFTKTGLIIGGAAIAAGALVYLATSKRNN